MKILFLTALLSFSAQAETINYNQLVEIVSQRNYTIQAEAIRVQQANKSITMARRQLLPSLNIWRIIGAVLDPISLVTEDLVPFLVPNNWFRLKQSESLYEAEVHGFTAMRANLLLEVKQLYIEILMDQKMSQDIETMADYFAELERIAHLRERVGSLPLGTTKSIRLTRLRLDEDVARTQKMNNEQLRLLKFHLGLPMDSEIVLDEDALPTWERSIPYDAEDFLPTALQQSPERLQHLALLKGVRRVRKETLYSWAGVGTNTRGVAGGVFDSIPVSDGLGLATSSSIQIAKLEQDKMQIQLKGIEEGLVKEIYNVCSSLNTEQEILPMLVESEQIASDVFGNIQKRMRLGELVHSDEIANALKDFLSTKTNAHLAKYRAILSQEKLQRLTMGREYQN
jgi:outer membrane protein TolC